MRVIGISPSHDASVSVINNGVLEYFFKEERFTKRKRDNFPYLSLMEAHKLLDGAKVDTCVIASPCIQDGWMNSVILFANKLFRCPIRTMGDTHHLQHASLAFENSNYDKALVFVVDRNGSIIDELMRESETVFVATKKPYNFDVIYQNFWAFNLGQDRSDLIHQSINRLKEKNPNANYTCRSCFNITKVYESATTLISQDALENGKTMGLSSYGVDTGHPNLFLDNTIPIDTYFAHIKKDFSEEPASVVNIDLDIHTTPEVTTDNYHLYANYAYAVQQQTQREVCKLIQKYVDETGITNVVVTGGYGLNIVSNSYYIENNPNVQFYFEPLADDSGNSIGAALHTYKNLSGDDNSYPLNDTFYHGIHHDLSNVVGPTVTVEDVAHILLQQQSVAVYYGLSESGPRALGHRSILFDATNPNAKDIVNQIKKREWYRPFAAVCLEEDANKYFDMIGLSGNKYMTNSFRVREEYRDILSGVVHVDGTCRVQTINQDSILYDLVCMVKAKNNTGILLNTSFNLAGQPLVETPQDAIKTLDNSCLDHIWFPEKNTLITRFWESRES